MTCRLALALLLCASPLVAEDVAPNATAAESGTSCTTSDAHTTMGEDPDSPDGSWCTADVCEGSSGSDPDLRFQLATPSANPVTTTDAQVIALWARQCSAGSGSPSCRLDLWCNGVEVEQGGSSQTISSTTGQLITEAVTFSAVSCAADGSDMEIRLVCNNGGGSPSNRRSVDLGAVEARVEVSAGRDLMIVSLPQERPPT